MSAAESVCNAAVASATSSIIAPRTPPKRLQQTDSIGAGDVIAPRLLPAVRPETLNHTVSSGGTKIARIGLQDELGCLAAQGMPISAASPPAYARRLCGRAGSCRSPTPNEKDCGNERCSERRAVSPEVVFALVRGLDHRADVPGRRGRVQAVAPILTFVQLVLAGIGKWVGSLHVLNAVLILGMYGWLTYRLSARAARVRSSARGDSRSAEELRPLTKCRLTRDSMFVAGVSEHEGLINGAFARLGGRRRCGRRTCRYRSVGVPRP